MSRWVDSSGPGQRHGSKHTGSSGGGGAFAVSPGEKKEAKRLGQGLGAGGVL
jgi:hypothetical protein